MGLRCATTSTLHERRVACRRGLRPDTSPYTLPGTRRPVTGRLLQRSLRGMSPTRSPEEESHSPTGGVPGTPQGPPPSCRRGPGDRSVDWSGTVSWSLRPPTVPEPLEPTLVQADETFLVVESLTEDTKSHTQVEVPTSTVSGLEPVQAPGLTQCPSETGSRTDSSQGFFGSGLRTKGGTSSGPTLRGRRRADPARRVSTTKGPNLRRGLIW